MSILDITLQYCYLPVWILFFSVTRTMIIDILIHKLRHVPIMTVYNNYSNLKGGN